MCGILYAEMLLNECRKNDKLFFSLLFKQKLLKCENVKN